MKFFKILSILAAGLALLAGLGWLALGLWPNPLTDTGGWDWTVRVTDREGRLLKEFLPPRPARREDRPLSDFSPNLIAAVLTTEDKRFYRHVGVDPLAMLRAAWLNLRRGRIVSGASTITMQLARLNRGLTPGPRTLSRKLREVWWALLIERHNDKDTILAEYLNQAPCGNLTEGFPAAAGLYLGKSVGDLSAGEAAFLAGLPASPGALNPYKDPRPALARRSSILKKMEGRGFLSNDEATRARAEPLDLGRLKNTFNAPHLVSYLRSRFSPAPPPVITTTLDLDLQKKVEELVAVTAEAYREQGLSQAALVVLSLPERQVLAWVGSADFFDAKEGQNDGVMALRQPGSALKPFIYALAFDQGLITPATLIADQAADYRVARGSFSPANYSRDFHGPVSARLALASSLNLPAVKLATAAGLNNILARFRDLGLESLSREADYYGLGLVLGGGEVNLLSLTTAYAALSDGGRWRPPILIQPQPGLAGPPPRPVFSPGAAFLVTDILADRQARVTGFGERSVLDTPYPAAVKTGTSKNFRDNWCVGYTGSYIIGVWAGNFEASPMDRVSGVTGAGAVWRRVADLLAQKRATPPFKPAREVAAALTCPESGLLAGPHCPNRKREFFLSAWPRPSVCDHRSLSPDDLGVTVPVVGLSRDFSLTRPLSGEIYAWDPGIAPQLQRLKAQAQSVPEVDELVWSLNGREIKRQKVTGYARAGCLLPPVQGRAVLEVRGLSQGRERRQSRVSFMVYFAEEGEKKLGHKEASQ
ncbi:MAG: penicillin-binding protein 1C [Candidatus Adiutrix sp.]|jgi:penicillin-binding protein 1C|nr:penicillin-binding protein 1C [Candidatus Adiutrix sp.]